jgi:superfamily I DNA/RNA helicase
LSTCYRQKENVGKATKQVVDNVANSTPILRDDKINAFWQDRQFLTQISNNLIFVNPHGYTEYYSASTVNDVKAEVNRILKDDWLMWKHCPGLLILLDGCDLSKEATAALEPLMHRDYVQILSLDQIEKVKGLEFQHVFLFIDKGLFEEIQKGFKGSGQKTYHRRRLLRIPFSRAKDSLVTFAIDSNE